MDESFRYYLRVRYGECDAQKVVYNARYGDYVDIAATEFLRALGVMENDQFDYQVVKLTITWKAPARFRQVLELSVHVGHVGNTSFTLNVDFRIAGEEAVIANGEMIAVSVDPKTLAKCTVPPTLRETMLRGAPGVQVDHADYLPRRTD